MTLSNATGFWAATLVGSLFCLTHVGTEELVAADETDTNAVSALSAEDRAFFERLARQIEPDLRGDASRLAQYIRFYQDELANDVRLFAFQVTAHAEPADTNSVRLSGFVEFSEHRTSVENLLRVLGFDILSNDIALLPEDQLDEFRFGLLTASQSLSYSQPTGDREVVTECLIGEPLFLLKKSDDHYLCHSGEGYLGYVAARDIRPVNEMQFTAYQTGDRVLVRSAHEVGGRLLPAGARLKLIGRTEQGIQVQLPDGSTIYVSPPECVVQRTTQSAIDQIVATGKSLLGTNYLWGGKTNAGVDCSGLVQVAFQASGYHLPRDSNQQVLLGSLSGSRWCTSAMRRGDTMYFLGRRGRIRHTALYLGDSLFLHAVTPVVTIGSLDPDHPIYDARRRESFAFAKRLFD
jgi:hypothetical protein